MAEFFPKFEAIWKIIWDFLYSTVLAGLKPKKADEE